MDVDIDSFAVDIVLVALGDILVDDMHEEDNLQSQQCYMADLLAEAHTLGKPEVDILLVLD